MMDPSTKQFEPVDDAELARIKAAQPADPRAKWPVIKIGMKVVISGVVFEVRKITRKDVLLRPVR